MTKKPNKINKKDFDNLPASEKQHYSSIPLIYSEDTKDIFENNKENLEAGNIEVVHDYVKKNHKGKYPQYRDIRKGKDG